MGKITRRLLEYQNLKVRNSIKRTIIKKRFAKYVFILSPPYCGSTLLTEILSTSNNVSLNNPYGVKEGQRLPELRKVMFDHKDRFNENYNYDWKLIKKIWLRYWDITKPILLEKSPSNIIRATSISRNFQPSFFIIFYRNPYAHCESLMRRNGDSAEQAARFAIKCLQFQKENINNLKDYMYFSYEELTEFPDKIVQNIYFNIPEINDIKLNGNHSSNFYLNKDFPIRNLNNSKIRRISKTDLLTINKIFKENIELINYFQYGY